MVRFLYNVQRNATSYVLYKVIRSIVFLRVPLIVVEKIRHRIILKQ